MEYVLLRAGKLINFLSQLHAHVTNGAVTSQVQYIVVCRLSRGKVDELPSLLAHSTATVVEQHEEAYDRREGDQEKKDQQCDVAEANDSNVYGESDDGKHIKGSGG